jgi:hypothetical protein
VLTCNSEADSGSPAPHEAQVPVPTYRVVPSALIDGEPQVDQRIWPVLQSRAYTLAPPPPTKTAWVVPAVPLATELDTPAWLGLQFECCAVPRNVFHFVLPPTVAACRYPFQEPQ